MRLVRDILAGALAAFALTACAAPLEEVESEGSAISAPGCPADPSCTDRGDDGNLCVPACSPRCRTVHREIALWASPYEVAGTFDLGRHQGLAIVAIEYGVDPRFRADKLQGEDARRLAWPPPASLGTLPADVTRAMTAVSDGHDHARFALCAKPEVILDRPLANHGRPLSRDERDRASRVRLLSRSLDESPRDTQAKATVAKVRACVERITNGYCDSVCGNCSYVLPEAAIMTSAAGDYSAPASRVASAPGGETYYGGPGQRSISKDGSDSTYPNPYTHCAQLGAGAETEAPSLKSLVVDAPLSGLYGHNSNTDAEAEFVALTACLEGRDGTAQACGVCGREAGGPTGARTQMPCVSRTNTAANFWTKTADPLVGGTFRDKVPPVRRASTASDSPPQCSWAQFAVHGM